MRLEKSGFVWICFLVLLAFCARIAVSARSEQEIRERFFGHLVNSSAPSSGGGSIAKMFDRVLDGEFPDKDQSEGWRFVCVFKKMCLLYLITSASGLTI